MYRHSKMDWPASQESIVEDVEGKLVRIVEISEGEESLEGKSFNRAIIDNIFSLVRFSVN